ncbi:MAG TPA: PEP-CTERM sorting domain-containing protein [Verrucomicrobiae bacterium]|nr:PEP-CTERM sorting domain-containing protein [Verrucomicrobiae bacterium]
MPYTNGPVTLATVTVNDTVGSGGSVAFDSGIMGSSVGGSFTLSIPVNGNYSLDTGGQTYTGTFSYTFDMLVGVQISQMGDGTLTFNEQSSPAEVGLAGLWPPISVTADNGVQLNLSSASQDGAVHSNFEIQGTAVVPEPNSLAILGCGVFGFAFWPRRQH